MHREGMEPQCVAHHWQLWGLFARHCTGYSNEWLRTVGELYRNRAWQTTNVLRFQPVEFEESIIVIRSDLKARMVSHLKAHADVDLLELG